MEKALHSRSAKPSESFHRQSDNTCAFCGGDLAIGHDADRKLKIVHTSPACVYFLFCLDAEQFAMFTQLKINSDLGNRERN